MAVPLGLAVEPNETIQLEVAWTARVPRPFARTGYIGDFYFIAQWFPKLGVLEDAGWNTHQFHSPTEFYADFGVYDVRITVPTAVRRRRHRAADRAHRERRRLDDVPVSRRGRPRLRVDGEPGLRSIARGRSLTRRCRRSRCASCSSPSIAARPIATSPPPKRR